MTVPFPVRLKIHPKFLHVTDMPVGLTKEEGLLYLAKQPNPRNLPIKVWPEPPWWPEVVDREIIFVAKEGE